MGGISVCFTHTTAGLWPWCLWYSNHGATLSVRECVSEDNHTAMCFGVSYTLVCHCMWFSDRMGARHRSFLASVPKTVDSKQSTVLLLLIYDCFWLGKCFFPTLSLEILFFVELKGRLDARNTLINLICVVWCNRTKRSVCKKCASPFSQWAVVLCSLFTYYCCL